MGYDLSAKLGIRVRTLRAQAGITQADLAERSDLSSEFVSRLERGRKMPSLATLDRIASALGVTSGELLSFGPPVTDKKQAALAGLFSFLAPYDETEIRLVHEVVKVILRHRR